MIRAAKAYDISAHFRAVFAYFRRTAHFDANFRGDIALAELAGARLGLGGGELPELIRVVGVSESGNDLVSTSEQLADKLEANTSGCPDDAPGGHRNDVGDSA